GSNPQSEAVGKRIGSPPLPSVERKGFETTRSQRHGGLMKSRTIPIKLVQRSGEKRVLPATLRAALSGFQNSPVPKYRQNSGISAVVRPRCRDHPDSAGGESVHQLLIFDVRYCSPAIVNPP